ncbi:hypothetical protein FY050_04760 [Phyllobacterium endophyticum]|uniref:Uncharacterized protein n=1 Tax=Phyllobacterium endophyticum TaxID=1149773 RepID=A0A2P7AQZ1_9HYPH|nr:hypothetical protein [Phyllobacterium endophyticum]PSH56567.1 hypothetical protein CU100_14380 [Phyllobacterium endophyticum]TYR44432.1 hypothetical protein FY050_04760 [Phyllobacterium endophyticum]
MVTKGRSRFLPMGLLVTAALLTGCGTVQEKTAPCKRPAEVTSYADDRRLSCGPMRSVNDPAIAFAAIGLE